MKDTKTQTPILPPAVASIMAYAAFGLAVYKGCYTRSGKPRRLALEEWVPLFYDMIETQQGISKLQDLAETGMRAWAIPEPTVGVVAAALRHAAFLVLARGALENYAATAPRSISLPPRPRESFGGLIPDPNPNRGAVPEPASAPEPARNVADEFSTPRTRRRSPKHYGGLQAKQTATYRPHPIAAYRAARRRPGPS
jgi:hypothetical protein